MWYVWWLIECQKTTLSIINDIVIAYETDKKVNLLRKENFDFTFHKQNYKIGKTEFQRQTSPEEHLISVV